MPTTRKERTALVHQAIAEFLSKVLGDEMCWIVTYQEEGRGKPTFVLSNMAPEFSVLAFKVQAARMEANHNCTIEQHTDQPTATN